MAFGEESKTYKKFLLPNFGDESKTYKKFLLQKNTLDTLRFYIDITDEFLKKMTEKLILTKEEVTTIKVSHSFWGLKLNTMLMKIH